VAARRSLVEVTLLTAMGGSSFVAIGVGRGSLLARPGVVPEASLLAP
jgi:hypothetical protein